MLREALMTFMFLNPSVSSTLHGRLPGRHSSDTAADELSREGVEASTAGSWKRLLRVFTEPERRTTGERRRGRDPLRCEDWSEGKRQTIRRATDRE
jgi:hypothetical protein